MKELLVTIIFIVALVAGVYWYAGHAVKTENMKMPTTI